VRAKERYSWAVGQLDSWTNKIVNLKFGIWN
jgi:hypothetical protein